MTTFKEAAIHLIGKDQEEKNALLIVLLDLVGSKKDHIKSNEIKRIVEWTVQAQTGADEPLQNLAGFVDIIMAGGPNLTRMAEHVYSALRFTENPTRAAALHVIHNDQKSFVNQSEVKWIITRVESMLDREL